MMRNYYNYKMQEQGNPIHLMPTYEFNSVNYDFYEVILTKLLKDEDFRKLDLEVFLNLPAAIAQSNASAIPSSFPLANQDTAPLLHMVFMKKGCIQKIIQFVDESKLAIGQDIFLYSGDLSTLDNYRPLSQCREIIQDLYEANICQPELERADEDEYPSTARYLRYMNSQGELLQISEKKILAYTASMPLYDAVLRAIYEQEREVLNFHYPHLENEFRMSNYEISGMLLNDFLRLKKDTRYTEELLPIYLTGYAMALRSQDAKKVDSTIDSIVSTIYESLCMHCKCNQYTHIRSLEAYSIPCNRLIRENLLTCNIINIYGVIKSNSEITYADCYITDFGRDCSLMYGLVLINGTYKLKHYVVDTIFDKALASMKKWNNIEVMV